jgi:NADH-quinone oxidoreductase subunit C
MSHAPAATTTGAMQPGLSISQLEEHLKQRFGLDRDPRDATGLTMVVPATLLRAVILHLRDGETLQFAMLLDIIGIDYLAYPDHREARFAVVYLFKSLAFRQRISLKVWIDEERTEVPSIHDLFRIADWHERETWDQFGIVFSGHPNLKRLLNHHEFVGHPLRKDYPCQKRQKLSVNDAMVDQLEARLKSRGYTIVESGENHPGAPMTKRSAVPLGDAHNAEKPHFGPGSTAGALGVSAPVGTDGGAKS